MIENPYILVILFALIAGGLMALKSWRPKWFSVLPVPFWCYFLPMCLGTLGFFPSKSPAYVFLGRYALPFCLAALLINVSLRALARLGRPAAMAMALGAGGIFAGAIVGYALLAVYLPAESWKGAGALAATWTGGSANLLAVKEALNTPEEVFAPIVIVDTIFAYSWMALLILLAGHQARFDRWVKAPEKLTAPVPVPAGKPWPWRMVPLTAASLAAASILFGDYLGPLLSKTLSAAAPRLAQSFTPATWTVLFVTTAALAASLTGRFGARPERSEKLGTFILYVLLASLGARASLTALWKAPAFLALGACLILFHGLFLIVGGRWLRLPMFLLASASQACLGGVVSAPMVSAVYRPALSAVGLLLAVLGNVGGTYAGLVVAHLCRIFGGRP